MTAADVARSVVTALVAGGVREVVVSPGSRNAPLSFAVYDAAEAGLLRLHTRIDERTAGFLALGLTKGGSRAAVLCTSGTAVANLHPAVLEAHHARVPLVVVTADRPVRLRGTDANQTTDQVGIFGPLVATVDVDDGVLVVPPALVHLNVQLDDPLVPGDRWSPPSTAPHNGAPATEMLHSPAPLTLGPRTVVVAGDDAGPRARSLAAAAGWPSRCPGAPSSRSRSPWTASARRPGPKPCCTAPATSPGSTRP